MLCVQDKRVESAVIPLFSSTQTISLEIFLLHPTNLLGDIPHPPPPPFPPLHPIDQVVSIVVAGHTIPRKYQVRKKNKKRRPVYATTAPCYASQFQRSAASTLCKYRNSTVHGRRAGGMWWWEQRAPPSSLGVAAICVLGMANREYRIHVVQEIHPPGCSCVAGRVGLSQAKGLSTPQRTELLPSPQPPKTIVVSVVPDTPHIASIALALFRSSSTPSNPVCRSLSKIMCIPSLLLPS